MKKGIMALLGVAALALSGCDDKTYVDNYWPGQAPAEFAGVHVAVGGEEPVDLPIEGYWVRVDQGYGANHYYGGIYVELEGGETAFLSDGTYLLIEDPGKCPICAKKPSAGAPATGLPEEGLPLSLAQGLLPSGSPYPNRLERLPSLEGRDSNPLSALSGRRRPARLTQIGPRQL